MAKKPEWAPSTDDTLMLTEHLFYEIQMTFDLAGRLWEPVTGPLDITVRNAQIEAFAIHLRQLIDFFWGERRRTEDKMDAFAADYFAAGHWEAIRPNRPGLLTEELRRKVGWGVAHLTYDRAWTPPAGKDWDVKRLAAALLPVVLEFAESVDENQFSAVVGPAGIRACALMFIERVTTRSEPR